MENYIETLNKSIQYIKGVGEKRAKLLEKLSIFNVWDMLYCFPRNFEDRRNIYKINDAPIGTKCCVEGVVLRKLNEKRIKKNISLFALNIEDESGMMFVKWFSNPNYKIDIEYGTHYTFYGKIVEAYGRREMELEVMEKSSDIKNLLKIVPVYPLTRGLTQNVMRSLASECINKITTLKDIFSNEVLKEYNLMPLDTAVKTMHNPKSFDDLEKARQRLVFEELFVLQMSLLSMKENTKKANTKVISDTSYLDEFIKKLPFTLTDGQKSAIDEIMLDLKDEKAMNRLVQGDVGSGKTAVAAAAMYVAAKNKYQCAFMAPTEILATQHYNTLKNFYGDDIKVALLTGSTKGKKKLYEEIENGLYDIVVGTHAVIEDGVKFKNLILAVTDEQHRFGVNQRARLNQKGITNVLVMSATPIPRTLALILYGDLDISIIASLPKGRQKTDTFCVDSSYKTRAYNFVKKQLDEKRQGYVVCPLVEESETLDVSSGEEIYKTLSTGIFKDYKTALLHGKMKPKEKDEIMKNFKEGNIDLLVSTTVIEVGVDVPNANIMVIENAERFGLSQLHQLRGRVGRGSEKAYCILICDNDNETTKERMNIMTKTNDGFVISKKDLELRGCGQFFGTRQHGLPELKVANLFTDLEILKKAQSLCQKVIKEDPDLSKNKMLKERIKSIFQKLENPDILN